MELSNEFSGKYVLEGYLGKGAFSTVFACKRKGKKTPLAVKVISFSGDRRLQWEGENEVEILRDLHYHPHIITLQSVFRSKTFLGLILDQMPSVPLFHGIVGWPYFSEDDAKTVTIQLLEALNYCQSRRIVHRDLSPLNILWQQRPTVNNPTMQPWLRLIDFNLARRIPDGENHILSEALGHTLYMAPESLQDRPIVGFETDLWAVGVILFMMLVGYPPFWDDNYNYLLRNIEEANYEMPERYWNDVSEEGRNLVYSLLQPKLNQRISAQKALRHQWLRKHSNHAVKSKTNFSEVQARLLVFLERTKEHSGSNLTPKAMKLKAGMPRLAYIPDKILQDRVAVLMQESSSPCLDLE